MEQYHLTWITVNLAVGHAPMSYAQLDSIKNNGIDAIVNLCAEFLDLHDIEASSGFEVYYLPVHDEDSPKLKELEKALYWLDEAIYLGKKVLVHCRHGMGRTGTFVTSYMIRKGFTLKEASKKLKASSANPSNYGQWKLLKQYGKKSGALKIREPSLEFKNKVNLSVFFLEYESLIKEIDLKINKHILKKPLNLNKKQCLCGHENFELQLIEAVYLHSKINKHFTSHQRAQLIKKAILASKNKNMHCPFNKDSNCEIYAIRPAECRMCGIVDLSADKKEIQDMLFEISQAIFLAFSGQFIPDTKFSFSMADAISGKFVQKYFNYMSGLYPKGISFV